MASPRRPRASKESKSESAQKTRLKRQSHEDEPDNVKKIKLEIEALRKATKQAERRTKAAERRVKEFKRREEAANRKTEKFERQAESARKAREAMEARAERQKERARRRNELGQREKEEITAEDAEDERMTREIEAWKKEDEEKDKKLKEVTERAKRYKAYKTQMEKTGFLSVRDCITGAPMTTRAMEPVWGSIMGSAEDSSSSDSFAEQSERRWLQFDQDHVTPWSDEEFVNYLSQVPQSLMDALLDFKVEGITEMEFFNGEYLGQLAQLRSFEVLSSVETTLISGLWCPCDELFRKALRENPNHAPLRNSDRSQRISGLSQQISANSFAF